MEIIKTYAKQPSTWRGLALLLSLFGIAVDPELLAGVGTGVVAGIGLYETVKNRP